MADVEKDIESSVKDFKQRIQNDLTNIRALVKDDKYTNHVAVLTAIQGEMTDTKVKPYLDKITEAHYQHDASNNRIIGGSGVPVEEEPDKLKEKLETIEKNWNAALLKAGEAAVPSGVADKTAFAQFAIDGIHSGSAVWNGKAGQTLGPIVHEAGNALDSTGGKIGAGVGVVTGFLGLGAIWSSDLPFWEKVTASIGLIAVDIGLIFAFDKGEDVARDNKWFGLTPKNAPAPAPTTPPPPQPAAAKEATDIQLSVDAVGIVTGTAKVDGKDVDLVGVKDATSNKPLIQQVYEKSFTGTRGDDVNDDKLKGRANDILVNVDVATLSNTPTKINDPSVAKKLGGI